MYQALLVTDHKPPSPPPSWLLDSRVRIPPSFSLFIVLCSPADLIFSCNTAILRLSTRIPTHNPLLCPLRQLASHSRRYVHPSPSLHLLLHTTNLTPITALTFVTAPLPNALFAHCASDEFSSDPGVGGPVDLGRFITSIVVVTGFALPVVLAHAEVIKPAACAMSIAGGA